MTTTKIHVSQPGSGSISVSAEFNQWVDDADVFSAPLSVVQRLLDDAPCAHSRGYLTCAMDFRTQIALLTRGQF